MRPTVDLTLSGPTEDEWDDVCGRLDLFVWPRSRRLVVVSPHPDDETLGVGGLIASAVDRDLPVIVVAVTDGEAAPSALPDLAATRLGELGAALHCLGRRGSIDVRRLGFPDGRVCGHVDELATELCRHIVATDLIVCPLPDDGHPDHRAVAEAATEAAFRAGAHCRWFPVWAWHCHDPARSRLVGGERLVFGDDVLARKLAAVDCYASQLHGDNPVVPPWMLVRLVRPFEVLVQPR